MFKIYKNILTPKEKQDLLRFIKKEVKDLGENFPGLQTDPDLHRKEQMNIFLNKIKKIVFPNKVHKCWANHGIGNTICWHQHLGVKNSLVYYLYNPDALGVMFKDPRSKYYDIIQYTKGIENSLIKFEGAQMHSPPNTCKKTKRYTIALDTL